MEFLTVSPMTVTVKLYGMFKKNRPDYPSDRGLDIEIPEGARVSDLLSLLGITDSRNAAAIMDGRVLAGEEFLLNGATVNVLQIMSGG